MVLHHRLIAFPMRSTTIQMPREQLVPTTLTRSRIQIQKLDPLVISMWNWDTVQIRIRRNFRVPCSMHLKVVLASSSRQLMHWVILDLPSLHRMVICMGAQRDSRYHAIATTGMDQAPLLFCHSCTTRTLKWVQVSILLPSSSSITIHCMVHLQGDLTQASKTSSIACWWEAYLKVRIDSIQTTVSLELPSIIKMDKLEILMGAKCQPTPKIEFQCLWCREDQALPLQLLDISSCRGTTWAITR